MHQTQFSEKIPYGGFSQIRSHMKGIKVAHSVASYIASFKDVFKKEGCAAKVIFT